MNVHVDYDSRRLAQIGCVHQPLIQPYEDETAASNEVARVR